MKSVFFFTFHKCASSLFSSFVLPKAIGVLHEDFAQQLYNCQNKESPKPIYHQIKYIYGPLRMGGFKNLVYRNVVFPALKFCMKNACGAVFLVRDPRDILISEYFSFNFTHSISQNKTIAEQQKKMREETQNMTLDEYVLSRAMNLRIRFRKMLAYRQRASEATTLKYEDMIHDFDQFSMRLAEKIPLDKYVFQELFLRTRPKKNEDLSAHHRSGKTHQFLEKLDPKTQGWLKKIFSEVLQALQY